MNKDEFIAFFVCSFFMGWFAIIIFPGFHLGMYFLIGLIPPAWLFVIVGGIIQFVEYVSNLGQIIGG